MVHLKGLIPLWIICTCDYSSLDNLNYLLHVYNFSAEWTIRCIFKWAEYLTAYMVNERPIFHRELFHGPWDLLPLYKWSTILWALLQCLNSVLSVMNHLFKIVLNFFLHYSDSGGGFHQIDFFHGHPHFNFGKWLGTMWTFLWFHSIEDTQMILKKNRTYE